VSTTALRTSRARVATIVERSPGVVPSAVAVAVLLWFAGDEGGFRGTTWMPGMLVLLAVLFVCLLTLPRPTPSRFALLGVVLLTAYAGWSLLSILWAGQEELAWDAGNRTLLYALILALCTLWPVRGSEAAFVLGAYGLGVAGIAAFEMIKATGAAQSIQYFHEGRFAEPVGYANANAALWMLGFAPCAVLGGRRGVPALLRGLFLASACLLVGAALLGQSRGWLIALPLSALVAVVAIPGRGRTIVTLGAIGLALLPALDPLLDFYNAWRPFQPPGDAWDSALRALLLSSIGLGMVTAVVAVVDNGMQVSAQRARTISAGVVAALALVCVVGVVGYSATQGNPVTELSDRWDDFKRGGSEPAHLSSRFGASFGTYRYNYWEIAWSEFEAAPLIGAGADNFGRAYLADGESTQTPRFPHSTVMVALSETGIIGALLLFGAFAAALVAAVPGLRRADLAGAAGGAGVLLFAYWLFHSSLDWLWEFPGLAGAAMAGLGLATAVRRAPVGANAPEAAPPAGPPLLSGRLALALGALGAALIALSVVPPWLAERDVRKGAEIAATNPEAALERFERAADLNPLSPVPEKAAAIVELRAGNYAEAEAHLRSAFDRDDQDSGMYLLLATLSSQAGNADEARELIEEARRLAPRDEVIEMAMRPLLAGRRLDPQRVDRWISENVQRRVGPD
jgi:tetratricopeptide (TPR) repeat protein